MYIYILILLTFFIGSLLLLFLHLKIEHLSLEEGKPYSQFNFYALIFSALPIFTASFFFGFRRNVGGDYAFYIQIFNGISDGVKHYSDRFEVLFVYLNLLFAYIDFGPNLLLFTFYTSSLVLLASSIYLIGYRKYDMHSLSLILLAGIGPLFFLTNAVRQGFAISLGVFFSILFFERRILGGVIPSIFGLGWHKSSPIILALSIIPRRAINPLIWLLMVLLLFLTDYFFAFYIKQFLLYLYKLLGGNLEVRHIEGIGIRVIFDILLFLILSFHCHKIPTQGIFVFNAAFIGALFPLITHNYASLNRIGAYFYVFSFLALPWFLMAFKGWIKYFYYWFIYIYAILTFLRNLSSSQFVPYQLIFTG